MNYEKAYKEILEKVRTLIDRCKKQRHIIIRLEDIENIFPEFRESEDERIRKWLIDTIKAVPNDSIEWEKIDKSDVLAWLEKQGEQKSAEFKPSFRVGDVIKPKDPVLGEPRIIKGIHPKFGYDTNNGILDFEFEDNWELVEQKPIDKVEPKFKVGDILVSEEEDRKHIYKVDAITNYDTYLLLDLEDGYTRNESVYTSDLAMYLWTIQDAKDGDVLSYRDGQWNFIYKGIVTEDTFKYHALLSEKGITLNDAAFSLLSSCITPATKEQRDTLIKAMADAGYTFDFVKKELKKIEQKNKGMDLVEEEMTPFQKKVFCIVDTSIEEEQGLSNICNELLALAKQEIEQKPADKVEPKFKIGDKIQYLKGCGTIMTIEKIENGEYIFGNNLGHTTIEGGNKWHLVNLTEQTPTWSKKDEDMLNTIIDASEHHCMLDLNDIDWLKSIKDKIQPKQE